MTVMLIFNESPEFQKELKKLSKKWRSLPTDLLLAQKVITGLYVSQPGVSTEQLRSELFSGSRATLIRSSNDLEIVKMRLLCKDLKSDKMVRIVFIFIKNNNRVFLIEMYAHNDKNREDSYRINKYTKDIEK